MLGWKLSRKFSSSSSLFNPQSAIFKHQKNLHKAGLVSSRLKAPLQIREIDPKDWPDTGLLSFFGDEKGVITLHEAQNVDHTPKDYNTPTNSWFQICIPFSKSEKLRRKFSSFYRNVIRTGKLLEILDYVSGSVAYSYCYQKPYNLDKTISVATATVDNVHLFEPINLQLDLSLTSYVTYVGKSSMEIRIDISQGPKDESQIGTAMLVFVARDAKDRTKAAQAPKLVIDQEADKHGAELRAELGLRNMAERKNNSANSAFKVPPSAEESIELHQLFKKQTDSELLVSPWKNISDTKCEKSLIMHSQERNVHGKVFGGHIMREAFELGWLCAYEHAGQKVFPEIIHIDDVNFLVPVDVGSIVKFVARVAFVEGSIVHVVVNAFKSVPSGKPARTAEVHLTFTCEGENVLALPKSYKEGMMYLEAKRRVLNIIRY